MHFSNYKTLPELEMRLPAYHARRSMFNLHYCINQTWWLMHVTPAFRKKLAPSSFLDYSPFYILKEGLSIECRAHRSATLAL